MRRFLFPLVVVFALAVVAPAAASLSLERALRTGDGLVSLKRGRGTAVLSGSGTTIGHLRRGSLRIVDAPRGARTQITVTGYEHVRTAGKHTRVYSGRKIRFWVARGHWRVKIAGRGISASAAMRGTLALRGKAGTYSIDGGPDHRWPARRRVFRIG